MADGRELNMASFDGPAMSQGYRLDANGSHSNQTSAAGARGDLRDLSCGLIGTPLHLKHVLFARLGQSPECLAGLVDAHSAEEGRISFAAQLVDPRPDLPTRFRQTDHAVRPFCRRSGHGLRAVPREACIIPEVLTSSVLGSGFAYVRP